MGGEDLSKKKNGGEILIQVLGNQALPIRCRIPFYDKDKALSTTLILG